jgi:hypothetical protein
MKVVAKVTTVQPLQKTLCNGTQQLEGCLWAVSTQGQGESVTRITLCGDFIDLEVPVGLLQWSVGRIQLDLRQQ